MTQEELLEDTNRLLRRLVEMDEEQRAKAESLKEERGARRKSTEQTANNAMKEKLRELGLPEDVTEPSEKEMEARLKAARERSKENLEIAKQRQEQFQSQLLEELQTQSDLLRRIAEKLER